MILNNRFISFAVFSALLAAGCEKPEQHIPSTPPVTIIEPSAAPQTPENFGLHSTAMMTAGATVLTNAQAPFRALQEAGDDFLEQPSASTLQTAQTHWLEAVIAYRKFAFFRHLGLLDPNRFTRLNRLDYQIASYPIQPGFIDKFGEYQYSGLVFDVGFAITPSSLANQHGLTDLSEVVLGLYAIEFMLFDIDQERDLNDFTEVNKLSKAHRDRGFENTQELPKNRRRQLLATQALVLTENLSQLSNLWQADKKLSVVNVWQEIEPSFASHLTRKALVSLLTRTLLEIGALQEDEASSEHLSVQIKKGGFAVKQQFIHGALSSTKAPLALLPKSIQQQANPNLQQAINLTALPKLPEGVSEKDHWGDVFSQIKQATDIIRPE